MARSPHTKSGTKIEQIPAASPPEGETKTFAGVVVGVPHAFVNNIRVRAGKRCTVTVHNGKPPKWLKVDEVHDEPVAEQDPEDDDEEL